MTPSPRHIFLLLFATLCSCEIPRPQAEQPPGASSRVAPEEPTVPTEAEPEEPEEQSKPGLDGRKVAPQLGPTDPRRVSSVVSFTGADCPAPLRPAATPVQVATIKKPLKMPFRVIGTRFERVVLTRESIEWESALLSGGISVLDRISLRELQFEHFLQDASIHRSLAGAQSPEAGLNPDLTFRVPVTGRSPHPDNEQLVWRSGEHIFTPFLSGLATADTDKITSGRILSSKWLLDISPIEFKSQSLPLEVRQPTASEIHYEPAIAGTGQTPAYGDFRWETDPEDPFRLMADGDCTYFDPKNGSLWKLSHAWIGPSVSPQEYADARSTTTVQTCSECNRTTETEKPFRSPELDAGPRSCPECGRPVDAKFFDGYRSTDLPPDSIQVIVHWEWLPPTPGIYRILRNPGPKAGAGQAILFSSTDSDIDRLLDDCSPSGFMGSMSTEWCVVNSAGRVTVYPQKFLATFNNLERIPDSHTIEFPACKLDGTQVFRPASKAYREIRVELPLEIASASVRLVSTEDSSVLISGTLSLSFLNLDEAGREILVTPDGLDRSEWPNVTMQQTALRTAMREGVAKLLSD